MQQAKLLGGLLAHLLAMAEALALVLMFEPLRVELIRIERKGLHSRPLDWGQRRWPACSISYSQLAQLVCPN